MELHGVVGGEKVGLRLGMLHPVVDEMVLGYGEHWHKAQIHFNPSERVGCPEDKSCGAYKKEKANAWKCIGNHYSDCYPIGDMNYNVTMHFAVESHAYGGINANYEGGAEKQEVHVLFLCNHSVPAHRIDFDKIGVQYPGNAIVLFAHTPDVCPGMVWSRTAGGAIFLVIVACATLLYFGLGTFIMYLITGSVTIPQESFWMEAWASLIEPFVLVITLIWGKGTVDGAGPPRYDKI
jgi:hypothetical protein